MTAPGAPAGAALPVPEAAIALCRRFEGLHRVGEDGRVHPYPCPAGFPTIGYGHRVAGMDVPPISPAAAEALLIQDLQKFTAGVLALCPALATEPDGRLAALVDFAFNLGLGRLRGSTLRRRVNAADWPEAAVEIRKWVWGGGRKQPGLVARREAEAALLLATAAGSTSVPPGEANGGMAA